ncbi:MAG: FAD-binding oxidoreductase [Herpetosiphonaceae bacterium]|nr:FAD-binding oxidoreductase [Herpetosiphonaceae bacterium]
MSVSIWQTAHDHEASPHQVEVAIIGAGIIGAYLAVRLRQTGTQVLVLDSGHPASGASGRNGGLLLTGVAHSYWSAAQLYGRAATRELWALTVENREAMIGWATRLGTPVRRCGSYLLACTRPQSEEIRRSAAMMQQDDLPVEWHEQDPLGRGFGSAIGIPNDGAIQAALLTKALLEHSGAAVRELAEVYHLSSEADGVRICARGGDVVAQRVFLATNAWTPLLVPEFEGVVLPGRGQVIATAPAPRLIDRSCYCDDGFEYFQQLPDGRIVLGGYRNLAIEQEITYADHTTPLIQDALVAFLQRHFPELANHAIERRWSGTMAFTTDGLPLVGRLRRDDRIAFAVGFNGHGLGLGMMVVEALLRELAGGDASVFSARRLMATAA